METDREECRRISELEVLCASAKLETLCEASESVPVKVVRLCESVKETGTLPMFQYPCPKPPKTVNGYLFGAVLGEGSFARVKECVDTSSLVRYAVKIFREQRLRKIPGGWKVRCEGYWRNIPSLSLECSSRNETPATT